MNGESMRKEFGEFLVARVLHPLHRVAVPDIEARAGCTTCTDRACRLSGRLCRCGTRRRSCRGSSGGRGWCGCRFRWEEVHLPFLSRELVYGDRCAHGVVARVHEDHHLLAISHLFTDAVIYTSITAVLYYVILEYKITTKENSLLSN